jgi:SOS response regulatory protein OraA/RecX
MNDTLPLMKYAIEYLSKFNSSKKNLERILKNKIMRMKIEKKEKFILYNSISQTLFKLEENRFIDDANYSLSKIRFFAKNGKSKIYIKSYLIQKGVEKSIISNSILEYDELNIDWEKNSAFTFFRKKRLTKEPENYQKNLNKMARAGFSYDLCKDILGDN